MVQDPKTIKTDKDISYSKYSTLERDIKVFKNMIFTEKAADRVQELIVEQKETNDTALRVFVEGGGCHGFQYGFGFEKDIKEDDSIYETNGVKLVVDSTSIMYLADARVDYVSSMHGDRFVIDNPWAQTTCGCGSSFSI